MADPRFYANRGPFTLAGICAKAGIAVPDAAPGGAMIFDLASLEGAEARHLSFFAGDANAATAFTRSAAGFCFVPAGGEMSAPPAGMILLQSPSVQEAFAAAAWLFYPTAGLEAWPRDDAVDPTARLGRDVVLGPGAVIGPLAEIGDRSRIGAGSMIAPGVAIGRDCEIGGDVIISHCYIGDRVTIHPGARIGQPACGSAASSGGHAGIPQLGRVIVQDGVVIGANTTIDRGALGDTVIGEGSKLDSLVQLGSNVHIGRHCVVSAAGVAGGA